MAEFDMGMSLLSSNDGTNFNALPGIEVCKSCGKRTVVCSHRLPKEHVIQLPEDSTHLKVIKVESDMRMTMSTERNTRMSKIREGVMFTLLESVTSLEDIWEEIGIKEDQKEQRNNTVTEHIQELLKEMLAEEDDLKSKIKIRTQEYKNELEQLCVDLAVPDKQIPTNLSLVQLESRLRNDVDLMNKEKHDRLKTLKRLRTDEMALCESLMMPQHDLNFVGCPTLEQLRELEQNVKFLKAEKSKRFDLFKKLQVSIVQLWKELEAEPSNELEYKLCQPDADETFVLSTMNLDELTDTQKKLEEEHNSLIAQITALTEKVKSLWERLETPGKERNDILQRSVIKTPKVAKLLLNEIARLEELKRIHMQKFVESIRKELLALWNKCYMGEEQRQLFQAFYSEVYTEETLADHEHQVASMKNYYEENKDLFKLVDKRELLWQKKIDFESRGTDSNRLNNRGGALLKEEKMRKAVVKELPKIECEIRKKIIEWEKKNETYFMFQGERYVDFIELQRNEYESDQKIKKEFKARAKKQELSKESAYGSKPAKRKMVGTPSKSKHSRMDVTHGTPGRFVHSSICPSPRTTKLPEKKIKSAVKPKKANKIISENRRKSLKRRSIRLAHAAKKRVLSDKNQSIVTRSQEDLHILKCSTTLVKPDSNMSLMSYNEFSNAVAESPHSRSSFMCKPADRTPGLLNFTSISSKSSTRSSTRANSSSTIFDRSSKVFRI